MSRQNQRYAARLRKLANYVESLPAEQYNHNQLVKKLGKEPCGTVACAFGHAIASKQFPGLKVSVKYNSHQEVTYTFDDIPDYTGASGASGAYEWAEHYFGHGTWYGIFDTSPYEWYSKGSTVRSHVIKNLRKFAKKFAAA